MDEMAQVGADKSSQAPGVRLVREGRKSCIFAGQAVEHHHVCPRVLFGAYSACYVAASECIRTHQIAAHSAPANARTFFPKHFLL